MQRAAILILLCALSIIGQPARSKSTKPKQTTPAPLVTPQEKLKKTILASKKQRRISVTVESTIQNKSFLAIAEYLAPNRYSSKEYRDGILFKESVEIAGQRYHKKDDQWIRVRNDLIPLREQFFDLLFPQLYSKKGDAIKIKSVTVKELDEITFEGRRYFRYGYSISYFDFDWHD